MIKFGFKDYEIEMPNWSKHHKMISTHVKRVYPDGKVILPTEEPLLTLVRANEGALISKSQLVFDRQTHNTKNVTDYYLPLKNLQYEEANSDGYYSAGASNTKQTTHVRLTFLLDYDKFILDYNFKGTGSTAFTFYDLITSSNFIEDIIEEILDEGQPIGEVGIEKGKDEDYNIVAVAPEGDPTDFEVSKRDLFNNLVGVEVYRFNQEIVD